MRRWFLHMRWPLAVGALLLVVCAAGIGVALVLSVWVRPAIEAWSPVLACDGAQLVAGRAPIALLPAARWTLAAPYRGCVPGKITTDIRLGLWAVVGMVGLYIMALRVSRGIASRLWFWVQGVGRLVPGDAHGRARWATRRALRRRRAHANAVPFLVGARGRWLWRQRAWLSDMEQNLNVLIVGLPGVGKSNSQFIANMLRRALWHGSRRRRLWGWLRGCEAVVRPSGVATDPKGEFYEKTSKAFADNGYIVRRLDFYDPRGHRYNPLAHMESESDMQEFAQSLIDNTGGRSKEPYWDNTAIMSIVAAISHLNHLARRQGRGAATLAELRDFVGRADYTAMQRELLQSTPTARRMALSFMENVRKKPDLEGSIQTGLPLRFQFLSDPAIVAVTSGDDFDFEAMGQLDGAPWQSYIVITRGKERVLQPLTVMFFTQLFNTLTLKVANKEASGTLPRPVICDIDEAGTIGKIADLDRWLNTLRSIGVWTRLACQSFSQIVETYEELPAEAIAEACQMFHFFGGAKVSKHSAEWMSEQLGQQTVTQRSANAGRDREAFLVGQGGITRSETGTDLMSPTDFLHMKRHWMVVVPRHAFPYKVRGVPVEADRRLRRAMGKVQRADISATTTRPTASTPPRRGRVEAQPGTPLRARPRHVMDWSYDL